MISRRAATRIGHVDAALREVALTANGSGGPPDWTAALALLRTAAAHDPVAADQLRLIQCMNLAAEGAPATLPTPRRLSDRLNVLLYPALFTPDECRHVARLAAACLNLRTSSIPPLAA